MCSHLPETFFFFIIIIDFDRKKEEEKPGRTICRGGENWKLKTENELFVFWLGREMREKLNLNTRKKKEKKIPSIVFLPYIYSSATAVKWIGEIFNIFIHFFPPCCCCCRGERKIGNNFVRTIIIWRINSEKFSFFFNKFFPFLFHSPLLSLSPLLILSSSWNIYFLALLLLAIALAAGWLCRIRKIYNKNETPCIQYVFIVKSEWRREWETERVNIGCVS